MRREKNGEIERGRERKVREVAFLEDSIESRLKLCLSLKKTREPQETKRQILTFTLKEQKRKGTERQLEPRPRCFSNEEKGTSIISSCDFRQLSFPPLSLCLCLSLNTHSHPNSSIPKPMSSRSRNQSESSFSSLTDFIEPITITSSIGIFPYITSFN